MALIAEALTDMLLHVESARLADDANRDALEHDLARRWRDRQRQREQHLRRDVEALYQHRHLHRREQALDWQGGDLFSEQTRRAWGVSRAYLATAGFGAGALGGAGVDALAAGHSWAPAPSSAACSAPPAASITGKNTPANWPP